MRRFCPALVVGLLGAASPSALGAHDDSIGRFSPEPVARQRVVVTKPLPRSADSAAGGSASNAAVVTVRVYQQGAYSPGLVVKLQPAVTRLLKGSGFGLALVDCQRRPECQGPVRHELVLRVVPGRHRTNPLVCGASHPAGAGRAGVLMTAFRACVTETASALHRRSFAGSASSVLRFLTEADVLAPIVVHEVIHLLLPGEVHGVGLWKGVFDQRDFEHAAYQHLRLPSATAVRLQEVLAARSGVPAGGY